MKEIIRDMLEEFAVFEIPGKFIRVGSANDGGYVIVKDLLPLCPKLYSFGIGDNADFEADLLPQLQPDATADLYDPDPFLEGLPKDIPGATFHRDSLSALPKLPAPKNSFLKIDVEGAEWDLFRQGDILNTFRPFSQVVIELHFFHAVSPSGLSQYFTSVYQNHANRLNKEFFGQCWFALMALNGLFRLVHFHVNNSLPRMKLAGIQFPPLMELTFVRQDLISDARRLDYFPVFSELDQPNKLDRPNYYFI